MKKLLVLAFVLLSVGCFAQVTPTAPFPTIPPMMEDFDSIPIGAYSSLPVFGVPALAQMIGSGGGLVVRPLPPVFSAPNLLVGDGVDIAIYSAIPMRRFSGYF